MESFTYNIAVITLPLDTMNGTFGKWTVKYHGLYGVCYSLDLGHEITAKTVRSMTFVSPMYLYVFLHHEGQYLNVNSMMKVRENHFFHG